MGPALLPMVSRLVLYEIDRVIDITRGHSAATFPKYGDLAVSCNFDWFHDCIPHFGVFRFEIAKESCIGSQLWDAEKSGYKDFGEVSRIRENVFFRCCTKHNEMFDIAFE